MLASRERTVRAQVNGHAFTREWIGQTLRIGGQLIAMPVLRIARFDVDQIFGRTDGAHAIEHAAVTGDGLEKEIFNQELSFRIAADAEVRFFFEALPGRDVAAVRRQNGVPIEIILIEELRGEMNRSAAFASLIRIPGCVDQARVFQDLRDAWPLHAGTGVNVSGFVEFAADDCKPE